MKSYYGNITGSFELQKKYNRTTQDNIRVYYFLQVSIREINFNHQ